MAFRWFNKSSCNFNCRYLTNSCSLLTMIRQSIQLFKKYMSSSFYVAGLMQNRTEFLSVFLHLPWSLKHGSTWGITWGDSLPVDTAALDAGNLHKQTKYSMVFYCPWWVGFLLLPIPSLVGHRLPHCLLPGSVPEMVTPSLCVPCQSRGLQ